MELDVQTVKTVEPGRHTGTVMKVESRKSGEWDYTDITILLDDDQVELKVSAPTKISVKADGTPASKLAVILTKLGIELTGRVDLDSCVKKRINFVTTEDITANGTFAVIDEKTIKLVE